jgi:hypothetical protein
MFKNTFHLFTRLQKHCLLLFFFIAVSILVFFPTILGTPFWDDWVFIFRNGLFYKQSALSYFPGGEHSRSWPIFYSIMKLFLYLFGENFPLYHISSLLLHGVNGFLTWKILSKLQIKCALWLALLYMIHPLQLLTVGWIIQFKTILSSFFFLMSLIFLHKFTRTEKKYHLLFSLLLFLFSLWSKTPTIAIVGLAPLIYSKLQKKLNAQRFTLILIPFLLLATYSAIRTTWSFNFKELMPNLVSKIENKKMHSDVLPLSYQKDTFIDRTHLSLKIFSRYLLFLVIPDSNPLFQQRVNPTLSPMEFLLIFSSLLIIIYVGIDLFKSDDLTLRGSYLFFLFSLLPFCGLIWIPIFAYSNFVPYWLSIPMFGILPIIGHYNKKQKHLILAVIFYSLISHVQAYNFLNIDKIFLKSIDHSPEENVYYVALIEQYVYSGECQEARKMHYKLVQLSGNKEIPLLTKIEKCVKSH